MVQICWVPSAVAALQKIHWRVVDVAGVGRLEEQEVVEVEVEVGLVHLVLAVGTGLTCDQADWEV